MPDFLPKAIAIGGTITLKRIPFIILAVLLLLSSCTPIPVASGVQLPAPEPVLTEPVSPSTAEPDSVSEPDPEPESELPPEPVAEQVPCPFTDGYPLNVNGQEAASSVMRNGKLFVPLAALEKHLDLTAEPTECGWCLNFQNRTVWLEDTLYWEQDGALYTHPTAPICWEDNWYLPTDVLQPGLGLTVLIDTEYPHIYLSANGQYAPAPEGITVPVLMYHGIAETPRGNDELFVNPSDLEAQLQYLSDNGYTTVTFEDFPTLDQIEKPVMLTFDDGYDDNYTYLFPLLQKYNMKATIFVITGYVNFTYYLTEAQIKEMSDSGLVSIQSHTDTHPNLDELDEAAQRHELEISWLTLTRITGKVPFVLCYPTGRQNNITLQLAPAHYSYGLLMNGGEYTTGSNPHLIPRYYISRYTDLSTFAGYIQNAG